MEPQPEQESNQLEGTDHGNTLTLPIRPTSSVQAQGGVSQSSSSTTQAPAQAHTSDALSKGKGKRTAADVEKEDEENQANKALQAALYPQVVHRIRNRNPAPLWEYDAPIMPDEPTPHFPITPYAGPRPFQIYKALLRHPNLFFQFAMRLMPKTFTDLYSIDKEFHYRANKYSISLVYDFAKYNAPDAAYIFSWALYPELTISDPLLKPMDNRAHLARDIPSFRWVNMISQREEMVREILTCLALEGHRVEPKTKEMLMKFWVVMERADQAVREAFISAPDIWTDKDIDLFHRFLIKLDMRFSDPIAGNGCGALSHLLLTQKSLVTLRHVLAGYIFTGDKDSIEKDLNTMLIKTYLPTQLNTNTFPFLDDEDDHGVLPEQVGMLHHEDWTVSNPNIVNSTVDIIFEESLKRGLDCYLHFNRYIMDGWLDVHDGNLPQLRVVDFDHLVMKDARSDEDLDVEEAILDGEWDCLVMPEEFEVGGEAD